MTLADVRARVETDLDNTTLQRIFDSAVAAVDRAAGKAGSEMQTFNAAGISEIPLNRPASAITSVDERRSRSSDAVTLAADDYRLIGDYVLFREASGTNPASTWGAQVDVTYAPDVDQEIRDRVALDIIQVDVEFRAQDSEAIGDVAMTQKDYKARRRALLAQVREGRSPVL